MIDTTQITDPITGAVWQVKVSGEHKVNLQIVTCPAGISKAAAGDSILKYLRENYLEDLADDPETRSPDYKHD